jgi:4-hydroxyproline epimerase
MGPRSALLNDYLGWRSPMNKRQDAASTLVLPQPGLALRGKCSTICAVSTIAHRIHVIDSHTGGEPTRVVIHGGPDLGGGSLLDRGKVFREHYDGFRAAVVNEPRGSDVLVGGLLCAADDPTCAAAIIFFNNVGLIGMCGHGTIGAITTLAHLGRLDPGEHRIETVVGVVTAKLHADGRVSVTNVPSYRKSAAVAIEVPGIGKVTGDVAWGGNWFFLVENHGQSLERENAEALAEFTWRIRRAVNAHGFPEIDHIELFGPAQTPGADARNFVLCPGGAYDRSPCGTGTSAKVACLAADGNLEEGVEWTQESLVGSTFVARYRWLDRPRGLISPTITGTAYITAESELILDERDPFRCGIQ